MDEVIAVIAKAQTPDGYISTDIQLVAVERWRARHHEIYNMGHLITAAWSIHRTTGKTNLWTWPSKRPTILRGFQAAARQAGALLRARRSSWGWWNCTAPRATAGTWNSAQIFVDMRGTAARRSDQFQDRVPLRKYRGGGACHGRPYL